MKWVVVDINASRAYGPFSAEDEAFEYANALAPEDGNANLVVVRLVHP